MTLVMTTLLSITNQCKFKEKIDNQIDLKSKQYTYIFVS